MRLPPLVVGATAWLLAPAAAALAQDAAAKN